MNNGSQQSEIEKGFGILEAVIAVAILVIVAFSVSHFFTGTPKKVEKSITDSSVCDSISSTVVAELTQDATLLDVKNYGPGAPDYPGNAVDRYQGSKFAFLANSSDTSSSPSLVDLNGASSIYTFSNSSDVAEAFSSPWLLNNFMNIENSFTRLVSLANRIPEVCVQGIENNALSGVGVSFRDLNIQKINELLSSYKDRPDFELKVAIDILNQNQTSVCGLPTKIARPQDGAPYAIVQVSVKIPDGSGNAPKECTSQGRVAFPRDSTAPLTIVALSSPVSACAGTLTGPAVLCGSDPTNDKFNLEYDLLTVLDEPGCRACIAGEAAKECPAPGDQRTCITNGSCRPSDAGSVFLCHLGERNWFVSNTKRYEPCEYAKLVDYDGTTTTANVSVQYLDPNNAKGTKAKLKIFNLPTDRAWLFDVRAVDTSAQSAGASVCGVTGKCNLDGGEIITQSAPPNIEADLRPLGQTVAKSATPPTDGTVASLDAQSVFQGYFECSMNQSFFTAMRFYARPGATVPGPGDGMCTVTMSGGGTATCQVQRRGSIRVVASPSGFDGNRGVQVQFTDACGRTKTSAFSWCIDTADPYTMAAPAATNGTSPLALSFTSQATPPKACNLVYACPGIGSSKTYQLNHCAPSGYDPMLHSGCKERALISDSPQLCLQVIDPCGRTANTAASAYSLFLALSNSTQKTNHSCMLNAGNACYQGYCAADKKCYIQCSFEDRLCADDGDCVDAQICPMTRGDCRGLVKECSNGVRCNTNPDCAAGTGPCVVKTQGRCTCPTNKTCAGGPPGPSGAIECPAVNSCGCPSCPAM